MYNSPRLLKSCVFRNCLLIFPNVTDRDNETTIVAYIYILYFKTTEKLNTSKHTYIYIHKYIYMSQPDCKISHFVKCLIIPDNS